MNDRHAKTFPARKYKAIKNLHASQRVNSGNHRALSGYELHKSANKWLRVISQ